MKSLRIILSLFAVLIFFSAAAYAMCNKEHDPKTCDRMKGPRYESKRGQQGGDIDQILAAEGLDLSEKQRKELETLKKTFEKEKILVKAENKVKRIELEELLKNFEADRSKVEAKVKEMSDLNAKLLLRATMLRLEARKVLTPAQFEKAREIIEKRREK